LGTGLMCDNLRQNEAPGTDLDGNSPAQDGTPGTHFGWNSLAHSGTPGLDLDAAIGSLEPHWLRERPVAGRVPGREPDPGLLRRVRRAPELVLRGRRLLGGRDDRTAHAPAVAPHDLDELQREGPFHLGHHLPRRAVPLDPPARDEHLARRDEELARA